MYVDNSVNYDTPTAIIDNMQVIQEAVKKSGLRYKIIPPPSETAEEQRTKDISRRFVSSHQSMHAGCAVSNIRQMYWHVQLS